eukprot:6124303-Heterocapsa_arctica.AAC.1
MLSSAVSQLMTRLSPCSVQKPIAQEITPIEPEPVALPDIAALRPPVCHAYGRAPLLEARRARPGSAHWPKPSRA